MNTNKVKAMVPCLHLLATSAAWLAWAIKNDACRVMSTHCEQPYSWCLFNMLPPSATAAPALGPCTTYNLSPNFPLHSILSPLSLCTLRVAYFGRPSDVL